MNAYCRDCAAPVSGAACADCGGERIVAHPELACLAIAHVDCDAFFASIEKRDRPELAAAPVIVGGGKRGVVAAACYVARAYGVRSAMPMFKALRLCPDAVVVKPDIGRYGEEGRIIRGMMQTLSPLVQPVSIDEAFIDLTGLEALHGGPPAQTLVRLQQRIEAERRLTVSIGLSWNKFLAKLASDLDKPRGFSVIGRAEALERLAPLPVSALPGVGPAGVKALAGIGARTIADLRGLGPKALASRFGDWGLRLHEFAYGRDDRPVDPEGERKSVSAETTFAEDIAEAAALEDRLWPLCEKVAGRARAAGLAGLTVTLKLKTAAFRTITRRRQLAEPTLLAARLFEIGRELMRAEADGRTRFRLLGIGLSEFAPASEADKGDLLDDRTPKRAAAEAAIARAREKYGRGSVVSGRSLKIARRRD